MINHIIRFILLFFIHHNMPQLYYYNIENNSFNVLIVKYLLTRSVIGYIIIHIEILCDNIIEMDRGKIINCMEKYSIYFSSSGYVNPHERLNSVIISITSFV